MLVDDVVVSQPKVTTYVGCRSPRGRAIEIRKGKCLCEDKERNNISSAFDALADLQRGRKAMWKAVGNMQKEYRSTLGLGSRQDRLVSPILHR